MNETQVETPAPTPQVQQPVAIPAPQQAAPVAVTVQQPAQELVFMRPNTPGAGWEPIPYRWQAAINALGFSYDLRRIMPDGTEEVRTKTPKAAPTVSAAATRANPTVEFELWYESNGNIDNPNNKSFEQNAFLGGWFARQSAAQRR
jgi:hypothetical protein